MENISLCAEIAFDKYDFSAINLRYQLINCSFITKLFLSWNKKTTFLFPFKNERNTWSNTDDFHLLMEHQTDCSVWFPRQMDNCHYDLIAMKLQILFSGRIIWAEKTTIICLANNTLTYIVYILWHIYIYIIIYIYL